MSQLQAICEDCSWCVEGWKLTSRNEKVLRTKAERHVRMREEFDGSEHTVKVKAVQV